jgi:hypothetical protein
MTKIANPIVGMIIRERKADATYRKIVEVYAGTHVRTRGGKDGLGRASMISKQSLIEGRYELIYLSVQDRITHHQNQHLNDN